MPSLSFGFPYAQNIVFQPFAFNVFVFLKRMNLPQVTRHFNTVVFRIYFTFWKAGLHLPLSLFFCLKIFPAAVVIVHFPAVRETVLLNLPKQRAIR